MPASAGLGETVDRTRAVLELKAPGADLDAKQGASYGKLTPVEQAFGYAAKVDGCRWVIVSNFIEVRLVPHRSRPGLLSALSIGRAGRSGRASPPFSSSGSRHPAGHRSRPRQPGRAPGQPHPCRPRSASPRRSMSSTGTCGWISSGNSRRDNPPAGGVAPEDHATRLLRAGPEAPRSLPLHLLLRGHRPAAGRRC